MKLIEWVLYLIMLFGTLTLICIGLAYIGNGILQF